MRAPVTAQAGALMPEAPTIPLICYGFLPWAIRVWAAGLNERTVTMIILGVILLILGALLDIGILYTLGGILAVIGVVLWLLGAFGRQVGPRAHYY